MTQDLFLAVLFTLSGSFTLYLLLALTGYFIDKVFYGD